MKLLLLISVVASVVLIAASQPKDARKASAGAEQNVNEVNRAWVDALSHCDESGLSQMIATDCVITTEYGALGKPQFMQMMQSQPPENCKAEDLSTTEVRVQSFGPASIVTGLMSKKQAGKRVGLRFTNVFARRNGRWLLVTSHFSHVIAVTLEIKPLKPPK